MDLSTTQEDDAFRAEVRSFLEDTLPQDVKEAPSVGVAIEKPLLKKVAQDSRGQRLGSPSLARRTWRYRLDHHPEAHLG